MPKYRIDSIATLAAQMHFTPQETRSAQLDAAEGLLFDVDPTKAYPVDFIVFRITGYRPRGVGTDLLTGLALQHDLGLLIEQVSDSLGLRTTDLKEPVLCIEDVCERFNVTSKTIQRWRRRGLPARRFVYSDGKRRVGFLLRSVERFFQLNQDQVERGANFSQVDDSERGQILRRAARLAGPGGCCANEVARRIGRRLNRSPVTILHTIRKHDDEQPSAAILPAAPAELDSGQRAMILRGHRRGIRIRSLARRAGRSRSEIYRVLMDERIAKLTARKIRFIDDPLFHEPDAATIIEQIIAQQAIATREVPVEETRIPRDLPPYLASLYRVPLLRPNEERGLFLKFNLRKYQFVMRRRKLDPQFARARDLALLEGLLRRVQETKNEIVQANLRLVVSVARKHLRGNVGLMELVSEGNVTLMRAVESFDVSKGNRFSTYATLALMKGFARAVPQMLARGGLVSAGEQVLQRLPARERPVVAAVAARDEVDRFLSLLNDRERDVLRAHYGVDEASPASYDELGARYGLSKQRIRQIEQGALVKLRAAAVGRH